MRVLVTLCHEGTRLVSRIRGLFGSQTNSCLSIRPHVCKQVVSLAMFRLLINWVAGYLPECRDEPTFEAFSVLELAGLRL